MGVSKPEQQGEEESLSDGCIAHRNQVIQREINMQEVKKMMCTGKRLGMQFEGTEEEVVSRLLELEERDESRRQRG
ncbi:hypothetical protein SLE2022_161280 [Rubroshorea leprosula]